MNKLQKISLVITSINKPDSVLKKYYSMCEKLGVEFIIIGDKKTPKYPKKYNIYDIKSQKVFNFNLNTFVIISMVSL